MTQINEPSATRAYQRQMQAADRRPEMSATVLEFPSCRASLYPSEPPVERACAEVIQFPNPPAHLTQQDLDLLAAMTGSAAGDWLCEVERGQAEPSTVFVSGKPKGHDRAVLMICRSERKLLLIDAQLADDWRLLGIFDRVEDLANAWEQIIDG